MAKTFTDLHDNVVEIDSRDISLDTNEDIMSGKISAYFVWTNDSRYEVSESVYEKIQELYNL